MLYVFTPIFAKFLSNLSKCVNINLLLMCSVCYHEKDTKEDSWERVGGREESEHHSHRRSRVAPSILHLHNTGSQSRATLVAPTTSWSTGSAVLARLLLLKHLGPQGKEQMERGYFCVDNSNGFWMNESRLSLVRSSHACEGHELTQCYAVMFYTGLKELIFNP